MHQREKYVSSPYLLVLSFLRIRKKGSVMPLSPLFGEEAGHQIICQFWNSFPPLRPSGYLTKTVLYFNINAIKLRNFEQATRLC